MEIVAYDPSKDPEFQKFIEEIEKESERGIAIICHAYIHDLLKEILKKRLIKDKKFLGRLENYISFSQLLTLCYLTGIVTEKEKKEITVLNYIRNKFAHKRKANSFEIDNIPDKCDKLKIPRSFTGESTSQKKYILTAAYYIQTLNLKLKYTKKVRLVENESPELKFIDNLYL